MCYSFNKETSGNMYLSKDVNLCEFDSVITVLQTFTIAI